MKIESMPVAPEKMGVEADYEYAKEVEVHDDLSDLWQEHRLPGTPPPVDSEARQRLEAACNHYIKQFDNPGNSPESVRDDLAVMIFGHVVRGSELADMKNFAFELLGKVPPSTDKRKIR